MGQIVLRGGRVIDPGRGRDKVTDLLIEGGIIDQFGNAEKWLLRHGESKVIDCTGMLVVPGLIDMHGHFRTPGQEHKEDFKTGARAAVAGGYTTVLAMANTKPVIDTCQRWEENMKIYQQIKFVDILQVSAVTEDLKGQKLVDFYKMRESGAFAFSDDGKGIKNIALLVKAAENCALKGLPLIIHCEESMFSGKGVMAAGRTAKKLGVNGMPKHTEMSQIYLGIKVAQATGCHVHLQHLSCAESVDLVRVAKDNDIPVTCETAPHYLSLTDIDVARLKSNAKMNPPLRGPADQKALKEGVIDGTIDVIATDHAPHTVVEKSLSLKEAPFGVIGLETAVAVVFQTFYQHLKKDTISYSDLLATMTINPAKILGLDKKKKGIMELGHPADVTVINPKRRKMVEPGRFYSKSSNCPWAGKRLEGWPYLTIHNGKIVMKDGKVLV